MKTIEMKEIDGLRKLPCGICGTFYSELKFRNGIFFCNDCRASNRVQAFIDGHVKPTAEEAKIIMKEFADVMLDDVDRKLHDFGNEIKIEIVKAVKDLLKK